MGRGQRGWDLPDQPMSGNCSHIPTLGFIPTNSHRDDNTHKFRKNGSAHRMKATGRDLAAGTHILLHRPWWSENLGNTLEILSFPPLQTHTP